MLRLSVGFDGGDRNKGQCLISVLRIDYMADSHKVYYGISLGDVSLDKPMPNT